MKNKILFAMLCIAVLATGCNTATKTKETTKNTEKVAETETSDLDASSEETTNNDTNSNTPVSPSTELTDDIYSFKFQYNNTLYSLPATYSEFVANGWSCEEEEASTTVKPDLNDVSLILYNNDTETVFYVMLSNFGNSVDSIDNCHVSKIMIRSDSTDSSDTVFLPSGIQLNKSTANDIEKAYGKPTSVYEGTSYTTYTYTLDELSYVELNIDSTTKTLSEINIDNPVAPENLVQSKVSSDTSNMVSEYKAPSAASDDFSSYIIQYDGDLYQFPAPVSAFLDKGWEIDTTNTDSSDPIYCTNSSVNAHDRGWVELKRNNRIIRARVFNTSDSAVTVENSLITLLSTKATDFETVIPMTISKGITVGTSIDDLSKSIEGLNFEKDDYSCYLYPTNGSEFNRFVFNFDRDTQTIASIDIDLSEIEYQ